MICFISEDKTMALTLFLGLFVFSFSSTLNFHRYSLWQNSTELCPHPPEMALLESVSSQAEAIFLLLISISSLVWCGQGSLALQNAENLCISLASHHCLRISCGLRENGILRDLLFGAFQTKPLLLFSFNLLARFKFYHRFKLAS
jgi:hypothetical protein